QNKFPGNNCFQDSTTEYSGIREFPIPFPTRGLYKEREAPVITALKQELQGIISSYGQRNPYKEVHCEIQEKQQMSFMNSGSTVKLNIHKDAMGPVNLLVRFPVT
ncbi:hypothetical protein OESDEN_08889, partial [Oesophagostomum dentatum]